MKAQALMCECEVSFFINLDWKVDVGDVGNAEHTKVSQSPQTTAQRILDAPRIRYCPYVFTYLFCLLPCYIQRTEAATGHPPSFSSVVGDFIPMCVTNHATVQ